MRQLSRLRHAATARASAAPMTLENAGGATTQITNNEQLVDTAPTSPCPSKHSRGEDDGGGKLQLLGPSKITGRRKRSLFLQVDSDNERGCMEAVSGFLAAIASAAAANERDTRQAEAVVVSPPLLHTSKGVGAVECRNSARDLLRFFGHTPLLHLEGIIWVKASGERGENGNTPLGTLLTLLLYEV